MDKRLLSERDICSKYILPALVGAGWDLQTQIAEERTLTAGRIIVRGKLVTRGQKKRADFVLYLKPNIPIHFEPPRRSAAAIRLSPSSRSHASKAAASCAHRSSIRAWFVWIFIVLPSGYAASI